MTLKGKTAIDRMIRATAAVVREEEDEKNVKIRIDDLWWDNFEFTEPRQALWLIIDHPQFEVRLTLRAAQIKELIDLLTEAYPMLKDAKTEEIPP